LSPENTFLSGADIRGVLCEGSTIDTQIIDAIFGAFLQGVLELEKSDDLVEKVKSYGAQLPPTTIGSFGQLQEWRQDFKEVELGHRHTSHLWGFYWGLYPRSSITPTETPDLAAATR
jgi:hypothetical protein